MLAGSCHCRGSTFNSCKDASFASKTRVHERAEKSKRGGSYREAVEPAYEKIGKVLGTYTCGILLRCFHLHLLQPTIIKRRF